MHIKSARRIHGLTQGFGGFLHLLGVGWAFGCGAGCREGDVSSLSANHHMKIKILNSTKNKSTLCLCRKSFECIASIFVVTNDGF